MQTYLLLLINLPDDNIKMLTDPHESWEWSFILFKFKELVFFIFKLAAHDDKGILCILLYCFPSIKLESQSDIYASGTLATNFNEILLHPIMMWGYSSSLPTYVTMWEHIPFVCNVLTIMWYCYFLRMDILNSATNLYHSRGQ